MPACAGMTGMGMRAKFRLLVVSAGFLFLGDCTFKSGALVVCGCLAVSLPQPPVPEAVLSADVGDRVFFDFASSKLSNNDKDTLSRQSAWLAKFPTVNVLVAGNADERGTETYNLALGQRRANAARDYLVANGVSESRIHTISYGKDCPVAAGHNQASYQQNRTAITSVQGNNPQNCH